MMPKTLKQILEKGPIEATAPCRIDIGGTLDISTFYFPLRHFSPCTVNMALSLRTRVLLLPYTGGRVKVSSRGFKSAEYPLTKAPMRHPLGLMFAIAAYFREEGIHIAIDSSSPPKSGLGGSSAAAVALVAALLKATGHGGIPGKKIAHLAHAIEGSVAGVPCGIQDQLAAVYGGVHVWYWKGGSRGPSFFKKKLVSKRSLKQFEKHLLLAYSGRPHVSAQINQKWVNQFLSGKNRAHWVDIIKCTHGFADALLNKEIDQAVVWLQKETAIRRRMTPEVLDEVGKKLVRAAVNSNCGARFTGAGGGGCIWAFGKREDIERLKDRWQTLFSRYPSAYLLDAKIDSEGVLVKTGDEKKG